jgi:acetyl esterase/lipase
MLLYLSAIAGCTRSALFIANGLARFGDYSIVRDINYGPSDLNHLDIYIPEPSSNKAKVSKPVVVFFYGGCWGGCYTGFKEDYLFVGQALASEGYVAVLADYRRYPEVIFPEIIDDARRAVEWVKANIENYGGDSENIFLMGHSAGAHLAAMLILNETYLSAETLNEISGFIGLAGPYDFLPFTKLYQRKVFAPEAAYPQSQPINFVDGVEPPLLLLYGNDDETVKPRNIINLAEKARCLGGKVETHYYDGIDHAGLIGSLSIPLRNQESVLADITRFIAHQHSQASQ